MLLAMIKSQENLFFMIAQLKVRKVEEVYATTTRRWSQGKRINQRTVQFKWLLTWVSSSYQKYNISNYRNLESLMRKHQAGWKHLMMSENMVEVFRVNYALVAFSFTLMVLSLTLAPGDFVV